MGVDTCVGFYCAFAESLLEEWGDETFGFEGEGVGVWVWARGEGDDCEGKGGGEEDVGCHARMSTCFTEKGVGDGI